MGNVTVKFIDKKYSIPEDVLLYIDLLELANSVICFNEESDIIDVRTHNTDLRNRLLEFSEQYPACCKLTDDDEHGGLFFEIQKGRLSFRLTAPYSEERRNSLSENAKKHGINHGKKLMKWFD